MLKSIFAAGAASLLFATPADASQLLFTISGTDNISFLLDSNPSPTFSGAVLTNPEVDGFYFQNLDGQYNGAGVTFNRVYFYPAAFDGGLVIRLGSSEIISVGGGGALGQLFTGTLAAPIFSPGSYSFTYDYNRGAIKDTLVISEGGGTPSVPEPGTWMLMLCGLLAIGMTTRRITAKTTSSWTIVAR